MYFQTIGERKGAWKKTPKLLNYQKTKRRKKQRKIRINRKQKIRWQISRFMWNNKCEQIKLNSEKDRRC